LSNPEVHYGILGFFNHLIRNYFFIDLLSASFLVYFHISNARLSLFSF
jgi:hypothetical protein